MNTASGLVSKVTKLVSFPDVAMQVNDLLADDVSDADAIGSIIEKDPALTANLLKLANSSMYGSATEIDTVAKAFTRIGSREIQELTLGICASRAFSGIPNDIISVADFWHHSLLCGVAAKLIARRVKCRDASMVFTAGLLHDVGQLVMFHEIPEKSLEALALSRNEMDAENLHLAEREILGFDHADVGRALGELWNWPPALVNSIARHHQPFDYPDCTDSDVIIHLADSVATLVEVGGTSMADAPAVDERTWDRLGLKPDDVEEMLDQVNEDISTLLQIFAH